MATRKLTHRSNTAVIVILVLAIVIVANVLITTISHHLRLDLTGDKRFTLTEATKKTLRELDDRVKIKLYISEKFPNGLLPSKRRLEELLAEYATYAPKGYFIYNFEDPAQAVEPNEYEEFVRKLADKGLFLNQDRVQTATERGAYLYMFGALLEYRDHEPVALNTNFLAVPESLEYHLTRGIRSLVRPKPRFIGFLKGDDYKNVMEGREYRSFVEFLNFHKIPIKAATIENRKVVPDDVRVLVIVGESGNMHESDLYAIDQFVMNGGRLIVMTEGVEIMQGAASMARQRGIQFFRPKPSGLAKLLKHYGIEVKPGIMLDLNEKVCYQAPGVRSRTVIDRQGRRRRQDIFTMIFYPHVTSYGPENYNTDTYLTQGLGSTLFITASPLEVVENPINEAKAVPLVYTTDQSVFRGGQFITINESGFLKHQLDEMRGKEESKKYLVAAAMTGKFTSYFKGKAVPKPKPKPQPGGGGMSVPGIRDAIDPRGRGPRGPGRFPRKLPPGPPKPKKGEPKKVEPEKAEPKKGEAKEPAPPVRKEQPKKPEGETKTPPAPGKPVEPKEPPVPEKPAAPEKKPASPEPGESEIEEIDIPGGATQDPPPSPDSPKAAPPAPPTPPKPDKTEEPEPKKPETAKPDKAKPEAAKPEAVKPEAAKPEAAKPKPAEPGPGVPGVPGPGVPGAPPAGGNETVIEPVTVEKSGWSQVAVISDDRFIVSGPYGPHHAPRPGRPQPGTFVQRVDYSWRLLRNLLEWMLEDPDIVQIRGRGMQSHVLKSDITTGQTMIARIINLSLMPLIIIFAALLRWALKRRRRARLAAMEVE